MASRARQAYSLAVVMCIDAMVCLLMKFVNKPPPAHDRSR
jgi:hypothetical protein